MSESDTALPSQTNSVAAGHDEPAKRDLRRWLVEIFVAMNLGFLAVDIYIAHAANDFADPLEWIPIYFSAIVPIFLLPGIFNQRFDKGVWRWVGMVVGGLSILVGVVGMFLHLESAFFQLVTLKSLVYSAPFVAPLSYAGVGFLLLLNRMEHDEDWGEWIVLLSLGGMIGNFVLSVLDHAQNAFFQTTEYIPVVAAGLGVGFLATALFARRDIGFLKASMGIMALNAAVGLLGFVLHVWADLESPGSSLTYKFLYGAPAFAPLLFPNIALLAALGLWDLLSAASEPPSPSEPSKAEQPAPEQGTPEPDADR